MNSMRVLMSLLFLTLVLSPTVMLAAPEVSKKIESTPFQLVEEEIISSTTLPPPLYRLQTSLFYSSGKILEADESTSQFSLALNLRQKKYETGELDLYLTQNRLIGLFPGIRFQFGEDSVQRAYTKISTGMYLVPEEGFVNFITIRRLQLRAAMGLDNFLDLNHRLSTEIGFGASIVGIELFAQLGWIWFF